MVTTTPTPVAQWDFRTADPLLSADGRHRLADAAGSRSSVGAAGLTLDGRHDVLVIDEAASERLNLGKTGNEVTVLARVRWRLAQTGFVAGMWQEDGADPRRQYGLFVDLPTYGGARRVCGHVSADGRPSAGIPYSREYSASDREVGLDAWHTIGFTYDGSSAVSWLDGTTDVYAVYTEPGPPLGQNLCYSKNPYRFSGGLNDRPCAFTVGAVLLSTGWGNFFGGTIAGVAVWDRTLMPDVVADWSG